jgi:hypothetical protein
MLPRLCVAVAGPAIICSLFSPSNASAQAGTLTAAVSGFVDVPAGPVTNNQSVDGGGAIALRYAPNAWPQAALRFELSGLVPSRHDKSGPDSPAAEDANGSGALSAMLGPEFDIAAPRGHFYSTVTAGADHIWATPPRLPAALGVMEPSTTMEGRAATNFVWSGGGGYVTGRWRGGLAAELGIRYYDFGRVTYISTFPAPELIRGPNFSVANHHLAFLAPSIGVSWRP